MLPTFGRTPLACTAALKTIEMYKKEEILNNCLKMGNIAKELLAKLQKKYPIIKEIRGYGLMIGIEVKEKASDITKIAQQNGLLIITEGENILCFYPPLNITKSELKKGISILKQALLKIQNIRHFS